MKPSDDPVLAMLDWAYAALRSAQRMFAESASERDRCADGLLLVLALRNVERAAEWYTRNAGPCEQHVTERALRDFRRALPHLVNARDALEHFDEYGVGRGRLQLQAVKAGNAPTDYSFVLVPRGSDDFEIQVGPFRMGLLEARDACRELVIELLATVERSESAQAIQLLDGPAAVEANVSA